MGKFIGLACIIAAVLSLFLFDKLQTVIIGVAFVGLVCSVLQLIRNIMGEGLLQTIVILFCCCIPGVIAGIALIVLFPSLPDEAGGAVAMLATFAAHCIYNSCNWSS